jgi:hypothetical protein
MREVREMTEKASRKRGNKILLSARIMATPQQNLDLGLDLVGWTEEGLIDIVIVSHYLRNDYPLPVDEFRELMHEGIPIYTSIEFERDPEVYRSIARQLWEDGTDGIMLFNFAAAREGEREPPFYLLDELGDPEKLGI